MSRLVVLKFVEVLCGYLEHLSSTFCIGSRDERSVEIVVSMLVEIRMNSHCHVVTQAKDGSERVGAWTKMSNRAQVLHTQSLLLKRVKIRVRSAINFQFGQLDFYVLTSSLRGYKHSCCRNTRSCSNGFQLLFTEVGQVHNYLYVLYGGTVIEGYKTDLFVAATATNPTANIDRTVKCLALKCCTNICTLHNVCMIYRYCLTFMFNPFLIYPMFLSVNRLRLFRKDNRCCCCQRGTFRPETQYKSCCR